MVDLYLRFGRIFRVEEKVIREYKDWILSKQARTKRIVKKHEALNVAYWRKHLAYYYTLKMEAAYSYK
jgi:hypothetical protein